ncbi:MAG: NUDIX hydrolase [Candidatus Anstonellales archaeon]
MKVQEINAYLVPVNNGKVLVLKRDTECWEFPGGRIEFGEMPEITAVRECMEETGLKARDLVLLTVTSAVYEKGGDTKHSVYVVFAGRVDSQEIKLSGEHVEAKWVNIAELEFMNLCFNARDVPYFIREKNIT